MDDASEAAYRAIHDRRAEWPGYTPGESIILDRAVAEAAIAAARPVIEAEIRAADRAHSEANAEHCDDVWMCCEHYDTEYGRRIRG